MNNLVNRTEMSVSGDTIFQFVLVKFFTLPVHNFSSNVTYCRILNTSNTPIVTIWAGITSWAPEYTLF
jgi:hypothetical protein